MIKYFGVLALSYVARGLILSDLASGSMETQMWNVQSEVEAGALDPELVMLVLPPNIVIYNVGPIFISFSDA